MNVNDPQELAKFIFLECADLPAHNVSFFEERDGLIYFTSIKDNITLYLQGNSNLTLTYVGYYDKLLKENTDSKLKRIEIVSDISEIFIELEDDILEELNDLIYLKIYDCGITRLPKLPPNLEKLNIEYNNVEELPELPDSLIEIRCQGNPCKSKQKYQKSLADKFTTEYTIWKKR